MNSRISPPGSPARVEKNSFTACLACRRVKMKCRISDGSSVCDRCLRKQFNCTFEKHRRGRRRVLRPDPALRSPADVGVTRNDSVTIEQSRSASSHPVLNRSSGNASQPEQEGPHSDFWTLLEGFRPSGLLNKQAMTGKLSLENITHGHNSSDALPGSNETHHSPAEDPVQLGIVNTTIAASLFAHFMSDLNPYVCQLDPALHTFEYVQRKSSFLLSAVLSVAAKAFNPIYHRSLQSHAEDLFTKCFRNGKKSTEIVQAIMITTYWKDKDDTRVWLSIGYVIRMGMELGWHKLTTRTKTEREAMSELQNRETRNLERTWLLLFIYDRSLSLQTGSPSMIPRNELIDSAYLWYDEPTSTPHDRTLCALATLRMIGSEILGHRGSNRSTMLDRTDGLLDILLNDIDKWHSRWCSLPEMTEDNLYQFLIGFHGRNLRLLFSLFPLHATMASGLPEELIDKQSLMSSYSSAVKMLELLTQPNFSPLLYLVQDSIHIGIAYAAIFLVKLLLSMPQNIRSEIEGPAIEAVHKTADMFDRHAAPPNSGCDLQAKFLKNVLMVFQKAWAQNVQSLSLDQEQSQDRRDQSGAVETNDSTVTYANDSNIAYSMQDADGSMATYDYSLGLQDFAFGDDDIWSSLFADAGFSISEGVFM